MDELLGLVDDLDDGVDVHGAAVGAEGGRGGAEVEVEVGLVGGVRDGHGTRLVDPRGQR